jgi:hypothetical protein
MVADCGYAITEVMCLGLIELGSFMLKYLVPRIAWCDLKVMFAVAVFGALVAGFYGVLHDQITYSIGPEYFTKFKFDQFQFADLGLGDRIFVSCIGFLASWWVGFIMAWFLSRRLIPNQPRSLAYLAILKGFVIVFGSGVLAGMVGYFYGIWRGAGSDYSAWSPFVQRLQITDTWAFVRVAYIHNASYLGGVIGFLVALVVIRPKQVKPNPRNIK